MSATHSGEIEKNMRAFSSISWMTLGFEYPLIEAARTARRLFRGSLPAEGSLPTEGCPRLHNLVVYRISRSADCPLPAGMLFHNFKRPICSSLKKAYALHSSLCNSHDTSQIVTSQTVKPTLQREDAFRKNCRYTNLRWHEAEGDCVQRWREQTMCYHGFRCMFAYPNTPHSNFRHKLRNSRPSIGHGVKRGELPPPGYDIDISLVLWPARPLSAGLCGSLPPSWVRNVGFRQPALGR